MASNFTNNVISAINIKNTKYNIRAIPFHATEAEWNSVSYIPKQGEFIVYDADDNNTSPRFKTGDGVTDVKRLPFTLATISEVQAYVNSWIGSAGHLKRVVLEDDAELPEVSEADVDTIYMKRNNESRLISDVFDEYMVINGAWEIIGNTRVDLSNYTTQEMVDEKIETAISEIPQSDWNQNDPNAAGHVLNRTHYEEVTEVNGDTLTWDGNTEGRTVLDLGGYPLVHVSDAVVTAQDVANGYSMETADGVREFQSGSAQGMEDNVLLLNDETYLFCCSADNCSLSSIGLVFPKKGVYFVGGEYSIKSLTIPGYTGFTRTEKVVKQLDPKYIKDMYYTEGGMVEVLPETQVTLNVDTYQITTKPSKELVMGETYHVMWDGQEYVATAQSGETIGLPADVLVPVLINDGANVETGENFVFALFFLPEPEGNVWGAVMAEHSVETRSLSIYHDAEIVHKLDPKYLPNGVPYCVSGGMVEILPECQPVFNEDMGMFIIEGGAPDLEIGVEYTVNWNGTEYTCECLDSAVVGDSGGFYLGDIYTASSGQVGTAPTGEPFVMMGASGQMMIMPLDDATELTLSIYQGGAEIRKLDGRCLPSGVPYIEGEGTTKTVLAETTFTDVASPIQQPIPIVFKAGCTYIINWNGTEYTCTGYIPSRANAVLIGNARLSVYGEDTGEPFCMAGLEGQFIIWYNDGSTSVTVSIEQDGTVFHKIDERLLPENVGTTYTLTKEDSTIKLIGSDGSETSVNDSSPTLWSLGVHVTGAQINSAVDAIGDLPGKKTTRGEIFNDLSTNQATGQYSHAEGSGTTASGSSGSHAEGIDTTASGFCSHAEGHNTTASGSSSHAEGNSNNKLPDTIASESTNEEIITAWETTKFTLAKDYGSHAEGSDTLALGNSSHAEGCGTIASGIDSHAEGYHTTASGDYSHAEDFCTTASGSNSHAEGLFTIASGAVSHAEGEYTVASGSRSHVQGKYNIEDTENKYAHIVGNGGLTTRSNAHTLDWDGNAWFAGDVYVGSTSGTNKDDGSKKLATEKYVSDTVTSTGVNSIVLKSSTEGSNKRFKLTVDDTGTLTVTEI